MLRILKHPNIVEFHAAFTYQGRPTFLFGEADCDLKEWLRGDRSIQISNEEALEALYGLSSAMCQMHQFGGTSSPIDWLSFRSAPGEYSCARAIFPSLGLWSVTIKVRSARLRLIFQGRGKRLLSS